QEPFRTTPELLDVYLDALLRERPNGPYILGGFSYGGLVAFDLARKLAEAGEKVATIIMFDTAPPNLSGKADTSLMGKIERVLLDDVSPDVVVQGYVQRILQLPLTYRLIWGTRRELNPGEVAKLANCVFGEGGSIVLEGMNDASEYAKLEKLASELDKQDRV